MNSNGAKSRFTPPARDRIEQHYTTLGIPFVRAYLDPALDLRERTRTKPY